MCVCVYGRDFSSMSDAETEVFVPIGFVLKVSAILAKNVRK